MAIVNAMNPSPPEARLPSFARHSKLDQQMKYQENGPAENADDNICKRLDLEQPEQLNWSPFKKGNEHPKKQTIIQTNKVSKELKDKKQEKSKPKV